MSFAVSTSSFAGAKVALRKQQNVQKKQSTMVRAAAVSGEVPVRRYSFFFLTRWTYRLKREEEETRQRDKMSRRWVSKEHSRTVLRFINQIETFMSVVSIWFRRVLIDALDLFISKLSFYARHFRYNHHQSRDDDIEGREKERAKNRPKNKERYRGISSSSASNLGAD